MAEGAPTEKLVEERGKSGTGVSFFSRRERSGAEVKGKDKGILHHGGAPIGATFFRIGTDLGLAPTPSIPTGG
jgi:hypothetical protein